MTQALYLRTEAIDQLMEAVEVPFLNRKQQAALLGMAYVTYWRMANEGRQAGSRGVAAVLAGVDTFCAKYHCPKPQFNDLFELREVEDEPVAAIAA